MSKLELQGIGRDVCSALTPEPVGEVLRVVESLAELFGSAQTAELKPSLSSLHD